MSSSKIKQFIFFQILTILFVTAVSCNSKSTDDESEIVVTPALVAVKNFSLASNDSVLAHLDSVSFAIDLKTGVIFNADSLPKGTDVKRLIASITFANTMSKAELTFMKDNQEEVTIDYLSHPEDSIDFTYPVTLDVTAENGVNSFSYQIRVNVHNQESDTIVWDKLATSALPSRYESPVMQKTVMQNNRVYSLIEEYNGEFTLAFTDDLNTGIWTKTSITPGFVPYTESFTATPEKLWLLGNNGTLYTSNDGDSWNDIEEDWISILGAYGNSVLGIKKSGYDLLHTMYPAEEGFV